jgi:hypothetical protein
MKLGIALLLLMLLAVLLGSAWLRRGDLEMNGESGAMMVGLAVCVTAAVLVLWLT